MPIRMNRPMNSNTWPMKLPDTAGKMISARNSSSAIPPPRRIRWRPGGKVLNFISSRSRFASHTATTEAATRPVATAPCGRKPVPR